LGRISSLKKYFVLFSLIPLVLSIGIAPTFPFVDASEDRDAETQCRENLVLVFLFHSNRYVCVSETTASNWIRYGMAERVEDTFENEIEEPTSEEFVAEETQIENEFEELNAAYAQLTEQPNIIVIMPDDVGWYNIGAYHDGIMAGLTPNIDKIAEEGMRFTDYYADPSCTAGRASLITGELPIRTGLTTVGQAGAEIGMPAEAPTIATVLKSMGYSTGQFGKNHFGDLNKHLPTVHGFDEFFGYLYHLDALEDPFQPTFPQELNLILGPRKTWFTPGQVM